MVGELSRCHLAGAQQEEDPLHSVLRVGPLHEVRAGPVMDRVGIIPEHRCRSCSEPFAAGDHSVIVDGSGRIDARAHVLTLDVERDDEYLAAFARVVVRAVMVHVRMAAVYLGYNPLRPEEMDVIS